MVEAYSLVLFQASPAHGQRVTTASGDGKVFYEAAVKAVLEDRDLRKILRRRSHVQLSIHEYYDRYMELTRYVPEAFRHQHFVSEALVDRVRNAQNLHWKARGREDLHDVTMDELLANISKEYDKKHQTHEALRGHVPFSDTSGLPSVTVGCRVQGSRGSGENRSATTA